MGILNELSNKKYNVPSDITQKRTLKYYEIVIEKGWAKYLDALTRCGPFAMRPQFVELIDILEPNKYVSNATLNSQATLILQELEKLNFISTGFLNNYKYIYLKNSAYTLVLGTKKHPYRYSFKKEFNNEKFIDSLLKVEYLLRYDDILDYSNLQNQLYTITDNVYNLIIDSQNKYNYDISAIENILSIYKNSNTMVYKNIIDYLNTTNEYNSKLGIIRTLWEYLGKEYWKISRLRNTVTKEPFYLQLNLLPSGEVTIHYIAEIIIIDTNNSLDYYQSRNNTFFYMFFDMPNNNTRNIIKNFSKERKLGNIYDNIFGYKVKIIGYDKDALIEKTNTINKAYGVSEYSPMVVKCDYIDLMNVGRYLEKSRAYNPPIFIEYVTKIEDLIKKQM